MHYKCRACHVRPPYNNILRHTAHSAREKVLGAIVDLESLDGGSCAAPKAKTLIPHSHMVTAKARVLTCGCITGWISKKTSVRLTVAPMRKRAYHEYKEKRKGEGKVKGKHTCDELRRVRLQMPGRVGAGCSLGFGQHIHLCASDWMKVPTEWAFLVRAPPFPSSPSLNDDSAQCLPPLYASLLGHRSVSWRVGGSPLDLFHVMQV
jgi:hypothetical protein